MDQFYAFLTGPALWFTFFMFFGGLLFRLAYLFGISKERDRIFYNHMSFKWGFRSIIRWLIPWGSAAMRSQPIFTLMYFVFHACLLCVPIFLLAHNTLWYEAFGISLWSLPDAVADDMTIVLMIAVVFLFLRRIIRPEVRILTTAWDYTLLALILLPFLTGFLAYHQWGPYRLMLIIHVLSAEILLIVIPFSRLSHMVLFFFTRAFIGFEMGERRGARAW